MADMTEKEFAEKFFHDKAFKRKVVASCLDYDSEGESEHALGDWLAACGSALGYEFDAATLEAEAEAQIETLSGFERITFLGSFINAGRKAKKTKDKAAKEAAKEAAKKK